MTPGLPVLDLACATAGRKAAEIIGDHGVPFFSDLTTVLHRDGLYMVFVYLQNRSTKTEGEDQKYGPLMNLFYTLLSENLVWLRGHQNADAAAMMSNISSVFGDQLQGLIQAKTILERCLDYASAHAKSY